MKRVWNYAISMWQPVGALIIAGLLIGVLFCFQLGSLVKGVAPLELQTRNESSSLRAIINNPINTPYKTGEYLARKIHSGVAFERLISGLAAGLAIIIFYMLARRFTDRFAAIAGTVMFATSSALLHAGRIASPGIMVLVLLFLLGSGYRLRFNNHRTRSWLLAAAAIGLAVYTPGMIYFMIIGAIWQFRAVKRSFELPKASTWLMAGGILLLIISPLIFGFIKHPEIWREYFLIPKILPHLKNFFLQLLAVPAGVIAFAPKNALFRLGRQPTLDAFAAITFIVGIYTLVKSYKLDRLILFGSIFILGCFLTAFSGNYEYSLILLPFIYLTIAMGIGVLLESWYKTFPLNPLARSVALVVISLAVIVSVNFQARRYFIAWPHNDDTKAIFIR